MTKNAEGVLLKKSKLTTNGKPNLPAPSKLVEGELAINYAEGVETISTKNESGTVVTFSSDDYYTSKKLGDYFTGENSAKTVTEVMIQKERVTAEALIDLDNRKADYDDVPPELWFKGTAEGAVRLHTGSTASGSYSVSEGFYTYATGNESHTEGYNTYAQGAYSHAEGSQTTATTYSAHAEGQYTKASGQYSHAEGYRTSATTDAAHAEGLQTKASGYYSHTEGWSTSGTASASHAEGNYTYAGGFASHAEGQSTSASSENSHAEGRNTKAARFYSHAEGSGTTASGDSSHAEGSNTIAKGESSHAEGKSTNANGYYSHAEGYYTNAYNQSEHASGQYNVSSSASTTFGHSGNTLFSVGNGTSASDRKNALEIRQNGDIYIISGGTTIKLQDEIGNIDVDQVLDETTSASTNPVATQAVYNVYHEFETVVSAAINDLNTKKLEESDVEQVIDSTTSASTNPVSTSGVYDFVTSYTPSITVDQVLDDTTSASTNPIATQAVYSAITENEFVWSNAYVAISGAISSHTEDTDVHVTLNEKTAWDNKADGNHTHDASSVTAMTGYQVASSSASVLTTDTLLQTIGKLEKRIELLEAALGGMTLVKLTSQQYADLAVKDPNTLYIIND